MNDTYVHGYDQKENIRLQDQASTLVDLLHSDTLFPAGIKVLEAGCKTSSGLSGHITSSKCLYDWLGHSNDNSDELIKALTLMPKSLVEVGEYFYMQVFENMEKEWLSNYWIQTDHHSLASMAPADPLRYIATNKGVL
jgi:hypothetical protein